MGLQAFETCIYKQACIYKSRLRWNSFEFLIAVILGHIIYVISL